MEKKSLIVGAVALTLGGVLAKVFSVIYRIGLTRILGGVGIGLYQLIFPVYSLCVVLTTAGLPMAISKVIAKNKSAAKCVLKKCFSFTSIISLSLSFLLILFSRPLAVWQGEYNLTLAYIILAPSLILLSASSVLRGYFQGLGKFCPSAVSSVAEQFVKLSLGLVVSFALLKFGLYVSIIGAVVSIVVSEVVSLIILVVFYLKKKSNETTNKEINTTQILKDVFPITITNIILPIANFVDSLIVVKLLSENFSYETSVYLYGLETGAVSSFTGIPTIFSFALASVVLPLIAESEQEKNLNLTLKLVLTICVPCSLVFLCFPERLLTFLYAGKLNSLGFDGIRIASTLLMISSVGIIFLSINQIFSSSLQGINLRFETIKNLCLAVVIKFVIEIIFLPNKMLNIYALAIANAICYIFVSLLNLIKIKKHFKINIKFNFLIKLMVINLIMLLILTNIYKIQQTAIFTVLGAIFAIIIYFILIFVFDLFELKNKNKYLNI